METKVNDYSKAFNAFVKWAGKRTFNEILGCAKIGIERLCLIWDVDAYDFNKIAFRTLSTDSEGNWTEIEVVLENNICVFYHTKGDEVVPQNQLTKDEMIEFLKGNGDEAGIAELWNEYVDHTDVTIPKVFQICKFDLSRLTECLTQEELKEVISNLSEGSFNSNDKYFRIDKCNRLQSTHNLFDFIDVDALYHYVKSYEDLTMYGRHWVRVLEYNEEEQKNEWMVGEFPNGKMYMNNVHGYLALYHTNGNVYYSWI